MKDKLEELKTKYKELTTGIDLDSDKKKLSKLDEEISRDGFWNDNERAQKVVKERSAIKSKIDSYDGMKKEIDECDEFLDMALESDDKEMMTELEAKIDKLESDMGKLAFKKMLSGAHDRSNSIVSINSGAGGTEAQDWVEMLFRMYLRWSERRGYKNEITDTLAGEEAGLKNVTFTVSGEYAYGYLKAEKGIHRLVRISPFDTNKRRHTSFASVSVIPEIEDNEDIEIKDDDIRIDTYRASGAGGQHVNKTDSAVRITHNSSGIVVQCQNERSQAKNKNTAMKILRSKLFEKMEKEKEEKLRKMEGEKKDIAWGSQIRSYVLHPYRMVKDHRTNMETGNADKILDGDLDEFIQSYLMKSS